MVLATRALSSGKVASVSSYLGMSTPASRAPQPLAPSPWSCCERSLPSETTVQRWIRQADVDDGIRDGLTSAEQAEVVQLRRDKRRLEMENEILRRAAAYFAKDVLPK